ncbi:MAG: Spy/CpxP family protein refolding chaperone [Planctomycetia bacterium]|nr:Spy/CpxP family protein refolding chaperone [Planctomycetia bacterium]
MQQVALALSVLAVALAGWVALRTSAGPADRLDRVEAELDELRVLETRVANAERRLAEAAASRPGPVEPPPPRGDDGTLAASPRAAAASGAAGADGAAAPVESRLAELTKRLAAVEEKTKDVEPGSPVALARGGLARALGPRGFVTTLDDAQKQLDLSATQRADWDRTLAETKRELDDLRSIPDDEGKTWKQHNEDLVRGMADGSGRFDLGKLMALRGKKVPGRNETYGEAEARIRTQAKQRLRDPLTPEQQKKFDESNVDPLIGAGNGPVAFTFSTFGEPPKPPTEK